MADNGGEYGFSVYDAHGVLVMDSTDIVWNVAAVVDVPANTSVRHYIDPVLRYSTAFYTANGRQGVRSTPPNCTLNMDASPPYIDIQTFSASATVTVFVR